MKGTCVVIVLRRSGRGAGSGLRPRRLAEMTGRPPRPTLCPPTALFRLLETILFYCKGCSPGRRWGALFLPGGLPSRVGGGGLPRAHLFPDPFRGPVLI